MTDKRRFFGAAEAVLSRAKARHKERNEY